MRPHRLGGPGSGNTGLDWNKKKSGANVELQEAALETHGKEGRGGQAWRRRQRSETLSRWYSSPDSQGARALRSSENGYKHIEGKPRKRENEAKARGKDIFPVTKTNCHQLPQSELWN